ncbi:hypothetical protein [Nocardia brevicatena]|uniref:hypothetical protein n=1 Tax=Nocardia brevicatena TaxID=37327 RepID=UPI0002FF40A7|nr:hypothetical protein [Nocardia brevicatena]
MFRRFTTPAPTESQVDDLVAGALPDRVQIAHERLAHQDDPALLEALSERELAASRELAELVRDHERNEKRARIQAAADAAERVRRTAAELAEREAADLLRAAQAIGEQRRSSSPHAKVARLHQRKPRVLGLLAGVVAFSMLFSAVTVQQNIAPAGGAANPMFWLSYGLEALISAVLVALMLSTADTAEWGVIDKLWQVYVVEGVLLTASIALNTFPYVKTGNVTGFGIHAIAPIMIGVALVTHRLVAERYGRAIEQATAAVPDHEDLQARLAALTHVGDAANQILPGILTEQTAPTGPSADEPAGNSHERPDVSTPRAEAEATLESAEAAHTAPAARKPESPTKPARAASVRITDPGQLYTELGMATTPLQPAGQSRPATPFDSDPDEHGPTEADLDARLAAALRETLDRLRSGVQPQPTAAPGQPSLGAQTRAQGAPAPVETEKDRAAVVDAPTEPIGNNGSEPVATPLAEDGPPTRDDHAPRPEQARPATNGSPSSERGPELIPAGTSQQRPTDTLQLPVLAAPEPNGEHPPVAESTSADGGDQAREADAEPVASTVVHLADRTPVAR